FVSGLRGLDQLDDAGVSFPHTLVRTVRDAGVRLVDQADVRLREYGRHDLRTVNIDGSVVVRLVLALPGGGVDNGTAFAGGKGRRRNVVELRPAHRNELVLIEVDQRRLVALQRGLTRDQNPIVGLDL